MVCFSKAITSQIVGWSLMTLAFNNLARNLLDTYKADVSTYFGFDDEVNRKA